MKKLLVLLIALILVSGFAFAQEDELEEPKQRKIEIFNMEVSIGFPIHWTNGFHDNDDFYAFSAHEMEDKLVTANTSVGLGLIFNFTKVFGFKFDFDFFYGAKLAGFSTPTSDYNSLFGANVFIGPVFYLFNNDLLRVPFAVGAHMYYFADDLWVLQMNDQGAWVSRTELQFGPMVSLGIQFHFDNGIYIFNRTDVGVDLIRMHSIRYYDTINTEFVKNECVDFINVNWSVKPTIGIGLKY